MQDPRYAGSKFLLNCVEPGFNIFILVKFGKEGANAIFITVYSSVFSLWSVSTLIDWHLVNFS